MSANYENNYAIGEGMHTTLDGVNLIRSIVHFQVILLGDVQEGRPECSASDVLSSEESSVYGPCAGSNHRQRAADDGQHERHPDFTPAREHNPELHGCDQCSYRGSPQPGQDE